jgi:hypothetical protein
VRTIEAVEQEHAGDDERHDPDPRPHPGHAGLHVDGERDDCAEQQSERPPAHREGERAVRAEHDAHGTGDAGDADAGGEQLEHQQRQPDHEQQVRDRRAGGGVHEPAEQVELGEPHRHRRLQPRCTVGLDGAGGGEGGAVVGQAVQGDQELAERGRRPTGGRAHDTLGEGLVGRQALGGQTGPGGAELDGDARELERRAEVAHPAPGCHPDRRGDPDELAGESVPP